MADPFAISTPDPRFDPQQPVKINGYLFRPASAEEAIQFAIADAIEDGEIIGRESIGESQ